MTNIRTTYVNPPIGDRSHDWMAWHDRVSDEAGRVGYGASQNEAIRALWDGLSVEQLVDELDMAVNAIREIRALADRPDALPRIKDACERVLAPMEPN